MSKMSIKLCPDGFPGVPWVLDLKACLYAQGGASQVAQNPPANAGDMGSIPGSARSPRVGNGNPLPYSCLEKSTDREAWWATVAKNQTQLSTHTVKLIILFSKINL